MVVRIPFIFLAILLASCSHTQTKPSETVGNGGNCEHDRTTFRCVKFVRNYDGDTVTVDIPNVHPLLGEKIPIRVKGVDAPEIKGKNPCEKDAAKTAQQLVESMLMHAKQIELFGVERDRKYFRIVADVLADGQSIGDLLLRNKLAYEYSGETKAAIDWCHFTKGQNKREPK